MRGRQGSHPWQESHPWRGTSGGCLGWEQACAWTPIWLGATRTRASTWQAGSSDFMASPRRGGQRAQRAGDTGQIGQAGERTIGHFPGSEHRCEGPVGGPDLERDGAAGGGAPGEKSECGRTGMALGRTRRGGRRGEERLGAAGAGGRPDKTEKASGRPEDGLWTAWRGREGRSCWRRASARGQWERKQRQTAGRGSARTRGRQRRVHS